MMLSRHGARLPDLDHVGTKYIQRISSPQLPILHVLQ